MPKFSSNEIRWIYNKFAENISLSNQAVSSKQLRLLVLHVSESCNLDCTYCFADRGHYGRKKAKLMKPEVAAEAITTAYKRYGRIGAIKLFGGEPMLNIDALESVSTTLADIQASDPLFKKPQLIVITNMTIANERVLKWISSEKPIITGSIDGPSSLHNQHRVFPNGLGSFSVVDSNIRLMRGICAQPEALECVYTPHHLKSGVSITQLHEWISNRYDIHDVFIHPMGTVGDMTYEATDEDWLSYTKALAPMSREYGNYLLSQTKSHKHPAIEFLKNTFRKSQTNAHCDLGVNNITINASGEIYPCYTLLSDKNNRMGKITDMHVGDNFLRIQAQYISTTKNDISSCRECDIMRTCHSCPGEMNIINDSALSPYHISCKFLLGMTEGALQRINEMRNIPEEWLNFQNEISKTNR